MEILVYLLMFTSATFLTYIVFHLVFTKNENLHERMNVIRHMSNVEDEDEEALREPFIDRVINPAYQRVIQAIGNATPKEIKRKYEDVIISSGSGANLTFNSLIAIQLMLGLVLGGLTYLGFQFITGKINFLYVFIVGLIGFFLPYSSLNSKAKKRSELIQRALPDMLDLLYVSVEAGLAFDMALKKTSEKMGGPLSEEIKRSMDEISKGRNREDALRGMVTRTKEEDLSNFVTAVIQAEQLGSNISNVLRIQSGSMRQLRRQRAREKAAKIPVKMLFPLIFFMFPALFVIILGPAIINIMETFIGM